MARPGACRPEASCVGPPWFEPDLAARHSRHQAESPAQRRIDRRAEAAEKPDSGRRDAQAGAIAMPPIEFAQPLQMRGSGVIQRATSYVTVNMSDRGTIATFVALSLLSAGLVALAFILP